MSGDRDTGGGAILAVVTMLCASLLAGCGGDGDSPEEQVRAMLERYLGAQQEKDAQAFCQSLLVTSTQPGSYTDAELAQEARRTTASCLRDVSRDLRRHPERRPPRGDFEVGEITIRGDRGTAQVIRTAGDRRRTTNFRVVQVNDEDWRILTVISD